MINWLKLQITRFAAHWLRDDLAQAYKTACIQNQTIEQQHLVNQQLSGMVQGMQIQIQHLHAELKGQIH